MYVAELGDQINGHRHGGDPVVMVHVKVPETDVGNYVHLPLRHQLGRSRRRPAGGPVWAALGDVKWGR